MSHQFCPVCGLDFGEHAPEFGTCPCCESDFTGIAPEGAKKLRQIWVQAGCPWWFGEPPEGYDPFKQMEKLK